MKKLLTTLLLAIALVPTLAVPLAFAADDTATTDNATTDSTDGSATEEDTGPTYSIPKPDFLPGPSSTVNAGEDTQNFILNETIPRVINIAIGLLGITTFIAVLVSAITMLTSYGNEDALNRAKTNLRYSLIGFILIVFAYAIISIVVSVALPKDESTDTTNSTSWLIPHAYAATTTDTNDTLETLFPSQTDLIENQDDQGRVSLPSGDLISEIVPAIVTNILYAIGFLIFIAFMYGGALMIIGRGNDEMLTKAKNIIIYAGVALAVIAAGYAIIYGIATLDLTPDPNDQTDDVYTDATTTTTTTP